MIGVTKVEVKYKRFIRAGTVDLRLATERERALDAFRRTLKKNPSERNEQLLRDFREGLRTGAVSTSRRRVTMRKMSSDDANQAGTGGAAPEKMYKLQTKDQEICEVPASVVSMLKLVTTMLEDLNLHDDDTPIPIPNVTSAVLKKVITWCEAHKAGNGENSQRLQDFTNEFFKVEDPMIFELIMAANYLDIPGLLDDGCRKIASMMKGKTPEEIRNMFNIANDFTPEEEEAIRKENAWCEG